MTVQTSTALTAADEQRASVVLVSTYELGHQPFGLASPAAWLRRAGHAVTVMDLSRTQIDTQAIRAADLIAFYVPMHTATRLAVEALPGITGMNARAHLCFYGLYAPVNETYLRALGGKTILGGEFEQGLVALADRVSISRSAPSRMPPQPEPVISLAKQEFIVPDRRGLPTLDEYAGVAVGEEVRQAGYTEASRGCRHLCRHCPVVPVYGGRFRVVAPDVVQADIDQQVRSGAEHITFGDPDFFNGPTHAMRVVERLNATHPQVTYDVTIKIEHLLRQADRLPRLRDTGCLFVTTAVESIDDRVLALLDKRHTGQDFIDVVDHFNEVGLTLSPTFVTFHPWMTVRDYRRLLALIDELGLVDHVASVQLAVRLLIPAGSRLMERGEIRALVGEFDQANLSYGWDHPDPAVDALFADVLAVVGSGVSDGATRSEIFELVWQVARRADPDAVAITRRRRARPTATPVPHLTEPWFCCSEPLQRQASVQPSTPI